MARPKEPKAAPVPAQLRLAAAYVETLPAAAEWTVTSTRAHCEVVIHTTSHGQYRNIGRAFNLDVHKTTNKLLRKRICGLRIFIHPPEPKEATSGTNETDLS